MVKSACNIPIILTTMMLCISAISPTIMFAQLPNAIQLYNALPTTVDPIVDGSMNSFPGEYAQAGAIVGNGGTVYAQYKQNWNATSVQTGSSIVYPGTALFILNDLWSATTNETDDYNFFSMTYRSGVTISVWVFADPDEPNDSFWLPLSGLGYSTIDDRGFLVRKNNNPATDVQWFPGQPEPGDPGWNWNTYYGVFASAYTRDGWSGNEVYETVWYNTGNIPNQPPIIPCWTSVWMGVADPKNGQAQLQLVWIFQWWLHIGHSWAPDVAVNYVSSDKTVVGQGCSLNINVTVENPGNCSETFDVTLYANTTPIGNITVTDLPNDTFAVFVFVWNTTGFANGNYTLSAYAWPVPDETNTDNNNFTDGWTMVSIIGDITGPLGSPDSKVDMRDVGHVAKRFGTDPSKPLWDANDDITGPTIGLPDGKIDMRDIALVARHFGEHYP